MDYTGINKLDSQFSEAATSESSHRSSNPSIVYPSQHQLEPNPARNQLGLGPSISPARQRRSSLMATPMFHHQMQPQRRISLDTSVLHQYQTNPFHRQPEFMEVQHPGFQKPVLTRMATVGEEHLMEEALTDSDYSPGASVLDLRSIAMTKMKARKWIQAAGTGKSKKMRSSDRDEAMLQQNKRPYIEIPRALQLDIWKEAYPIVKQVYEAYKSSLGDEDQLTQDAKAHLEIHAEKFQGGGSQTQ